MTKDKPTSRFACSKINKAKEFARWGERQRQLSEVLNVLVLTEMNAVDLITTNVIISSMTDYNN